MPLHIGELHTEVVPSGDTAESPREGKPEPEWTRQEWVTEAGVRAEWLCRRVHAEAFDD